LPTLLRKARRQPGANAPAGTPSLTTTIPLGQQVQRDQPLATFGSDAPDDAISATLDKLRQQLEGDRPTNIGFPTTFDFDYTELQPFFNLVMNNVGDPYLPSCYPANCKDLEREVVEWAADLLRAPSDDRWGYVTTGGSEGNLYALHLARNLLPGAIVYYSDAAHYSIDKAIGILGMDSVRVRTDSWGETDYDDLATQIDRRRDRPTVVAAAAGTTMTEAVDDVRRIVAILDNLAVRNRFIHVDAALAGVPLATLNPAQRPGFDFADGADSIAVSGHKFHGSPFPSGIVLVKASHRNRVARDVSYIAGPDATISGSRSGHAALILWYAIRRHGFDGLRQRAHAARAVAAYAKARLDELGWIAFRHPHAFTVILKTPPQPIARKWSLAGANGWSHIIAMPGITQAAIDAFVADLTTVVATTENHHRLAANTQPPATTDHIGLARAGGPRE
jgi:histidine decarboxylase